MKSIYISKNKGKFFTIIALLFLAILITIRIVLTILFYLHLIPNVFTLFEVVIFGLEFNFDQLIGIYCIFAVYIIIDGFFDGILINLIDISFQFIFLFFILNLGRLEFIVYIPFSKTNIMLDLSLFLLIIIFTYFGTLIFEIYLFMMKIKHKEAKGQKNKKSKAEFKEGKELLIERREKTAKSGQKKSLKKEMIQDLIFKKSNWINRKKATLYFEDDEYPLFDNWKKVDGEYKVSFFQFYILNLLTMLGTGFIYGIIRYFLYDIPAPGNYYNYFLKGWFFPVYAVLLTSFISFRHFIRSLIYLFIIIFTTLTFWEINLITIEGTFLFSDIVSFLNFIFIDLSPYFNLMTRQELYNLYVFIMGIVIQIIFYLLLITMLIRYLRKRGAKMELFSSNKYLYIRDKDTSNPWMLLFDIISLMIWPFNPDRYRSLYNKIKFKLHSIREGLNYIYGRLSYSKSIKRLKNISYNAWKPIIELICLTILTAFTISYFFGYVFLGIILIEIYRYYKNREKFTIKAKYKRKKAQGSIFLNGNANLLYIYRLDKKIANKIPSIKSKRLK